MGRRWAGVLLAAGLVPVLAEFPARAGVAAGPEAAVREVDDAFVPDLLQVPVGARVTWVNDGRNPHTVTADDGSFDSGAMPPGASFALTFPRPGTYQYFCRYHGAAGGLGMAGTVVVGAPTGAGGAGRAPAPPPAGPGRTVRVPQDHPTIQQAVDAAHPGDLVLVSPGTYHEAVRVTTPYLTVRGLDRDGVVLDGEFRLPNGVHVLADGVAVENMTARHYLANGFLWAGVQGYRGSYLTAYGNGDYGLYAFDSVWGQFDHVYAAGHPDSGLYIGQCQPCHGLIVDSLAEGNALGYSGTNAGGDLVIARSEWRRNLAGIVPNTLDSELLAPQRGVTIVGNWVHDNDNVEAPAKALQDPSFGIGILVAGGVQDRVERNLVEGHDVFGIAVVPSLDRHLWVPAGNTVRDNVVRGSGVADLALGAPAAGGTCFAGNGFSTSLPPAVEVLHRCGWAPTGGGGGDLAVTVALLGRFARALGGDFPRGDWRAQPEPPPQAEMPDAATAPPAPAIPRVAVPARLDVEAVPLPRGTGSPLRAQREVTVIGVSVDAPTWWALLLSVYGYVLPLVLYATWVAVAVWDLVRRQDRPVAARAAWMAAILLLPVVGPVAYFGLGRSSIPAVLRATLVVGGLLAYLVVAAAAFLASAS
jgi:plastocyanin